MRSSIAYFYGFSMMNVIMAIALVFSLALLGMFVKQEKELEKIAANFLSKRHRKIPVVT
jgi:hypothetical protein